MSVLALIPARSGSKGIANKNFRTFGGTCLAQLAYECALAAGCDPIVLTTDVEFSGAVAIPPAVLLKRPPDLASDTAAMVDVVKHALGEIAGQPDDVILLVQPTQPLRRPEHLKAAIALLQASGADSVVSVVPVPLTHSPDLVCEIEPSGRLAGWGHEYVGVYQPTRRQDARRAYIRDGTVYAFRRQTVERFGDIYGYDVRPLLIDPADSCELDTEADWLEVERRWKERHGG